MIPSRANGLTAIGLAALALLAGCGDDEGGVIASDYDEVIVKADFVQAATEACEARTARIRARGRRVFQQANGRPQAQLAKELIDEAVTPGFEGELEDLRALDPPPGEEEDVEKVIAEIEGMLERMKEGKTVGRTAPYRRSENYAAAYGLPACGHP